MAEEKPDERPQWDNKAQFILTCVGFAVGLGNIWRFPYVLQSSGGGAFLIPYFIMLFLEGIPLLYVELTVGQLLRAGSIGVWNKIHPYLGGIGICSMFVSLFVGMYYNTIIAWCLWYIFNSFQEPLPWQYCPVNENRTAFVEECDASSPTQYFWYRETLDISNAIDISGGIKVNLFACLILAWFIVLICISKGIASSGKVVYFTATFPYLVLVIFLGQGLSLEGSNVGIDYLFLPDYEKLKDGGIWLTAATQIFFSLSLAFGGMIAFSSYNPRDNNCERDSVIVCLINSFTSVLASVVIFSVLGFKATLESKKCIDEGINILLDELDLPQNSITQESYAEFIEDNDVGYLNLTSCKAEDFIDKSASGTGLAFIVVAEAILSMPGAQFWSILFFTMLLTLGIDSMFGTIEGLITPLDDLGISNKLQYLKVPKKYRQFCMICIVVAVSFLVSLVFVQGSGSYWLDVFDKYAGGLPLLIIAFFELIAVGWAYPYSKYVQDIDGMLGVRTDWFSRIIKYYWWGMVPVISPLALVAVFVGYLYDTFSSPNVYGAWVEEKAEVESKEYPPVSVAASAIIATLCTIWILIVAALRFFGYCLPASSNKSDVVPVTIDIIPPNGKDTTARFTPESTGISRHNSSKHSISDSMSRGEVSVTNENAGVVNPAFKVEADVESVPLDNLPHAVSKMDEPTVAISAPSSSSIRQREAEGHTSQEESSDEEGTPANLV